MCAPEPTDADRAGVWALSVRGCQHRPLGPHRARSHQGLSSAPCEDTELPSRGGVPGVPGLAGGRASAVPPPRRPPRAGSASQGCRAVRRPWPESLAWRGLRESLSQGPEEASRGPGAICLRGDLRGSRRDGGITHVPQTPTPWAGTSAATPTAAEAAVMGAPAASSSVRAPAALPVLIPTRADAAPNIIIMRDKNQIAFTETQSFLRASPHRSFFPQVFP